MQASYYGCMNETSTSKNAARGAEQIKVGTFLNVRGRKMRVYRIHPFATYDVYDIDAQQSFRISGVTGIEGRAE